MKRRHAAALLMLAGAGLLGGCATTQPPAPLPDEAGRARVGRLAVQVAGDSARSFSAGFELEGSAAQGQLTLFSPIGLPLGRAQGIKPRQGLGARAVESFPRSDPNALAKPLLVLCHQRQQIAVGIGSSGAG